MDRDDPVAEILGRWREEAERGRVVDPREVISAHPEHADDLRRRFEAEALLERYFLGSHDAGSAVPEQLGDYRVVRELGRGGMGVVFEAEQVSMRRRVALKVLHPSVTTSESTRQRFAREARVTGRLHHTNVVTVHQMGTHGSHLYFAMELVDGRPLDALVRQLRGTREESEEGLDDLTLRLRGRGSRERIARAFAGVADALDAAHAQGVVHRDVKPSNLILDRAGVLKLTDFGLARLAEDDAGVTRSGERLGTPLYMSPEQVRARREGVDARTDVYSLGATLYEALSLHPPYDALDVTALYADILARDPVPLRRIDPAIPCDLATIVAKAMEKEPGDRYASAAAMAADLRAFAEGRAVAARRVGPLRRAARAVRRNRGRSALVAALVLAGAGGLWAVLERGRERERRADLEYDRSIGNAVATIVQRGRFSRGRLVALDAGSLRDVWTALGQAAASKAGGVEVPLLRALLPEAAAEAQLADLDAARRSGLDEARWHRARAFVLERVGRFEEGRREHAAVAPSTAPAAPLDEIFECYVCAMEGDRAAGAERLAAWSGDSAHRAFRALAWFARADARDQKGDASGALEDYAALESEVGLSWPAVRAHMAELWIRVGREETAKALFDEALKRVRATPAWGAAGYIGLVEDVMNRLPRAWIDRATQAAIDDHPDWCEVWALRSRFLGNIVPSDLPAAAEHMRRAIASNPDPPTKRIFLVELAGILAGAKKPKEALAACEDALSIEPTSAPAAATKARVLAMLGQKDEAIALAEATVARDSTHLPIHMLAQVYGVFGRSEEALSAYVRALRGDPTCDACSRGQLRLLADLGRWPELERAARRRIGVCPKDPGAWERLSLALGSLERWGEAAEAARAAVTIDPSVASRWSNLANALNEAGRPDEALPAIRHAMEKGFKHLDAYRVEADCLHRLHRTPEAIAEIEKAVAAERGKVPAYVWQEAADMLLEDRAWAEAYAMAGRGLASYGDDETLRRQQVGALRGLGRSQEALEACLALRARSRAGGSFWCDLAELQFEAGDAAAAVATAREGVERTHGGGERWVLGRLLDDTGHHEEAREAWRPLIESPLDKPHSLKALVRAGTLEEGTRFVEVIRAKMGPSHGTRWAADLVQGWSAAAGRQDDARAVARHVSEWPGLDGEDAAYLLVIAGKTAEAARLATSLSAPADAKGEYARARLYALLGRRDDALEWLRRSQRDGHKEPGPRADFGPYSEDPEFRSVVDAMR